SEAVPRHVLRHPAQVGAEPRRAPAAAHAPALLGRHSDLVHLALERLVRPPAPDLRTLTPTLALRLRQAVDLAVRLGVRAALRLTIRRLLLRTDLLQQLLEEQRQPPRIAPLRATPRAPQPGEQQLQFAALPQHRRQRLQQELERLVSAALRRHGQGHAPHLLEHGRLSLGARRARTLCARAHAGPTRGRLDPARFVRDAKTRGAAMTGSGCSPRRAPLDSPAPDSLSGFWHGQPRPFPRRYLRARRDAPLPGGGRL